MKKYLAMLVTLTVILFSVNSFAWDPPASPAPVSWISDSSGVLSPAAHARLDAKLKQINQSSANEVAALILPTLNGADIADVGDKTAKAWGVGKKDLDNGVLVVLAMKEHKSRISTGKGVEGDLPDLKCSDILQNVLRPHMRNQDVEGGLDATFDAIATSIANHKADAASHPLSDGSVPTATNPRPNSPTCSVSGGNVGSSVDNEVAVVVLVLALLLLPAWLFFRSQKRKREQVNNSRELTLAEEEFRKTVKATLTTLSHKVPPPPPVENTDLSSVRFSAFKAVPVVPYKEDNSVYNSNNNSNSNDWSSSSNSGSSSSSSSSSSDSGNSNGVSSSYDWGSSSGGDSGGFGGGSFGGGGSNDDF